MIRDTIGFRLSVTVALVSAIAVGCGEDVDVSRDEAVEVLVLDGVARERAECIADGADGVLSFAKVTGVDTDIDEDELADLARISASCVFVDDTAGIIGGESTSLEEQEGGGGVAFDVQEEMERLVSAGLAPSIAECVGAALVGSPDPATAAASDSFMAEVVQICSR